MSNNQAFKTFYFISDIARRAGLSESEVRKILRDNGIPNWNRPDPVSKDAESEYGWSFD